MDVKFAKKVRYLGADAIIAVNNQAGGHRGGKGPKALISSIKSECNIQLFQQVVLVVNQILKKCCHMEPQEFLLVVHYESWLNLMSLKHISKLVLIMEAKILW